MPRAGGWVELSEGNLANSHIYLRKLIGLFPADAIGASNAVEATGVTIAAIFDITNEEAQTDLDGEKLFLRCRGPIARFFEASAAKPGDLVLIEKEAPRRFRFSLKEMS